MTRSDNAQIDEPFEKVVPIADPEENAASPGVVSKRPFVFEKKRGSGGGNMPLMLMVVGVIVVFGLCMIAFLSSRGTAKKKMGAEAARPNLGRAQTAMRPIVSVRLSAALPYPRRSLITCATGRGEVSWRVDWRS
jgi:hypothetical protein